MTRTHQFPPLSPLRTGVFGRCPRCGQGRLFDGYLTVAKGCTVCELDYGEFDSGDGPAVLIILVVGFIVMGLALVVDVAYSPPYWVHAALWLPLILILSLGSLRPLKGLFLASQFRTNAREGRLADGS